LKLLTVEQKDRIGYTGDGEEILKHEAFHQESMKEKNEDGSDNPDGRDFLDQVKNDLYKCTLMPTLYNFDKDFNSIDNKEKISKAFDCFTEEEL